MRRSTTTRWPSAFAFLHILVFFACASASDSRSVTSPGSVTSPPAAGLDQPFTLAAGASVRLEAENLQVGFDRVVSDSRCPRGAQCIAEGEALVRVWLSKAPAARESRDLKTTPNASEAVYGAYRIKLVTLAPSPTVDRTIPPSDYVVTILVTRV